MQSQNLYFLAIIPHSKVAGEVTAYKEYIAQRYNSAKALRVMPHITLKAPFLANAAQHNVLCTWFSQIAVTTPAFTQQIDGFGAFNNPKKPVLYIRPVINPELLGLQQQIINSYEAAFPQTALSFSDERFSPHITIGYRDLLPEMFAEAWNEFKGKEYKTTFEVQSFCLLQHDSKKWNIIAEKNLL